MIWLEIFAPQNKVSNNKNKYHHDWTASYATECKTLNNWVHAISEIASNTWKTVAVSTCPATTPFNAAIVVLSAISHFRPTSMNTAKWYCNKKNHSHEIASWDGSSKCLEHANYRKKRLVFGISLAYTCQNNNRQAARVKSIQQPDTVQTT